MRWQNPLFLVMAILGEAITYSGSSWPIYEAPNLLHQIYCQNNVQLQIEHVIDPATYDQVLFVDADCSYVAPYKVSQVQPAKDSSYSTHAITPAALLYLHSQNYEAAPPKVFLLLIRGYKYELGGSLSARATKNLKIATT